MINLEKIFKRESAPDEKVEKAVSPETEIEQKVVPTIVGIVVEKTEALAKVQEILKDNGFSVDDAAEQEDGTIILKQGDTEGADIIRMNSHLLALVKDFPTENTSFVTKADGYLPGIDLAFGHMFDSTMEILSCGKCPTEEKVAKAEQALAAFGALIKDYASALPASLVNAADNVYSVVEGIAKEEEDDDKVDEKTPVTEPVAPVQAELPLEAIQKIAEKLIAPVTEQVMSVVKSIEDLGNKVSDISKKSESLEASMAEAKEMAKSAQAVVKGTVVGSIPPGDKPTTATKKADSDPRSGLFDTAFLPRQKMRSR